MNFVTTWIDRLALGCGVALASFAAASPAMAAPPFQPTEPDPARFTVDAATDFPIAVSGRLAVEVPFRLRLSTSMGVMPGPYVEAINGFLVGVGAYGDATSDLVRSTLSSSFVWRTHAGWRPVSDHGFYFEAGYGVVTLGGDATAAEIIAAATGKTPPEDDASRSFTATSTLHMIDLEAGWELVFVEYLSLRFALGGAFTVDASTTIEPDFEPRANVLTSKFTQATELYLDDIFESYAFLPIGTLALGVTF